MQAHTRHNMPTQACTLPLAQPHMLHTCRGGTQAGLSSWFSLLVCFPLPLQPSDPEAHSGKQNIQELGVRLTVGLL